MVPDVALRIHSLVRALKEVVIPAIPEEKKFVLEQAHLTVAHLNVIEDQINKIWDFEYLELGEFLKLTEDLIGAAKGGDATDGAEEQAAAVVNKARSAVRLPIPRHNDLVVLVRSLKEASDGLLKAAFEDGNAEFRKAASEIAMEHAEKQILRERVWTRKTGFDAGADELPRFEELSE